MAIDFQEEEQQKLQLAICSQHNLKYDPEITSGCVLCRVNRKKRISGYWVVAVIFAFATGIYFLLPAIRPDTEPTLSSMVTVGDRSTDNAKPTDSKLACLLELSHAIEKCVAKVDPASPNARMDKEFCLDMLQPASNKCPQESIEHDYLAEPLYKINKLPDWVEIRTLLEERQEEIESCAGSAVYDFTVRVSVSRTAGNPADVTLSLAGLDASQRYCLYNFFEGLTFPTVQSKDNYTFVTHVQSCVLALNRPEKTDDKHSEFKKFVQEQRNAKLTEDRHAEIMKRRAAFDKKFKSDMDK